MDAGDADRVVREFIAAIERKDIEAALVMVSADVVYENVPIGAVEGPDGIRAVLDRSIRESDQIEWVIRRQVCAGNVVMNERLDRFLAAGRWIELPVAGVFVVTDGQISLWRDYFDLASYRGQTTGG